MQVYIEEEDIAMEKAMGKVIKGPGMARGVGSHAESSPGRFLS